MIKADKVVHNYDVWKNDEKTVRTALSGVSLDVKPGQFIAILGSNGSGKSTFAKHLNVLLLPDEGAVWVEGKETSDENNLATIRSTVGMVFQNPDNQIIGTSVEEDVAFGPENRNVPSEIIQKKVADSLNAVGLFSKRKTSPSRLSGGQKQKVAVAGVLATDSSCIVFDEPTAMLDPVSRRKLMQTIKELHASGKTIILITHHTEEVIDADLIFLMDKGKVIAQGTPREIFAKHGLLSSIKMDVPKVTELANLLIEKKIVEDGVYLEEDELLAAIQKSHEQGSKPANASHATMHCEEAYEETLLSLEDIFFTYGKKSVNELSVLKGISLDIHKGEFIGLIGSSGAGKTTFIKHLNGLLKADSGDIKYKGESIYRKGYKLSDLRKKVGLVFQYPEHQLFCKTVIDDVCFGPKNMGVSDEEARAYAEQSLELVGIGPEYFDQSPHDLSGGQMRRVAIAGVLAMNPSIIVMDEPAAGLDPGTKAQVFELIEKIRAERGLTVVLVSHDMEDIADYTDRVIVLHDGQICMDGKPAEVFAQVDKVRAMGIDVPVVTEILYALGKKGYDIQPAEATVGGAACLLAATFRRGGGE